MRLIDADALRPKLCDLWDALKKGKNGAGMSAITDALIVLEEAETVDAVPVVRCRDCSHCFSIDHDPLEPYSGEPDWYCERLNMEFCVFGKDPERFFCADGERRENG